MAFFWLFSSVPFWQICDTCLSAHELKEQKIWNIVSFPQISNVILKVNYLMKISLMTKIKYCSILPSALCGWSQRNATPLKDLSYKRTLVWRDKNSKHAHKSKKAEKMFEKYMISRIDYQNLQSLYFNIFQPI